MNTVCSVLELASLLPVMQQYDDMALTGDISACLIALVVIFSAISLIYNAKRAL